MSDPEFNSDGSLLIPDAIAEIQRKLNEIFAIPRAMLEPPPLNVVEWMTEVSEAYLASLKEQKSIEDFSVNVGTPYCVYKFHITKKGYVIEHRRDTITDALSEHPADHWILKGCQGPHKSRRLLRKIARHILGEYSPVDLFFRPVKPVEYLSINLTFDKGGVTCDSN